MDYLTLKALHIIFIVTWFAGLFYAVRLFIYLRESHSKSEEEKSVLIPQFTIMVKRLWMGITWPSALITFVLGTTLIIKQPEWLSQPFMHIKLTFVFVLFVYHLICHRIYVKLISGIPTWTSFKLRIWNEVATLLLVAIVFLIVRKNTVDWLYGMFGLLIFALILMVGIRIYKNYRE